MQFFNLLLLTGAAFAKPSMRGADFGDYPFDGSMLADTVHSCTAGTPAGDVLEEAYNGCGQGDFQCFLGAMGWMDASGNVQHDIIMDDLMSLPEETADCLMDAAEDIYDSLTQEQIDAIASHPLVGEILNDFDFEQLFSRK